MAVLTRNIAASDDDARAKGDDSSIWTAQDDVFTSSNDVPGTRRDVGLRFANITIPRLSIINTAYVRQRIVTPTANDDPKMTIYGHDHDNSVDFAADPTVNGRAKTTASVPWVAAALGQGNWVNSPDLAAIIQEIVIRAGWASGQALTIVYIAGVSPVKGFTFYAFDHGSDFPSLNVNYTPPAPGHGSSSGIIGLAWDYLERKERQGVL